MSQLFKITVRWLKKDRKRTLLTFASIMLSVYLITFVGTFCSSAFSIYDSVHAYQNGRFHSYISDVSLEQADKIIQHAAVESSLIISQNWNFISGYLESNYDDSYKISYKINGIPVKNIKEWNIIAEMRTNDSENLAVHSGKTEGRMPEKAGETAISKDMAYSIGKVGIGDTVSINYIVRKGSKVFERFNYKATVTGIVSESGNDFYFSSADGRLKQFFKGNDCSTVVCLRIKNNCDAVKATREAGLNAGISKMTENEEFYMNGFRLAAEGRNFEYISKLGGLIIIAVVLIAVFTFLARLIINNAFELSIAYRTEQYGALKTVGASDKQIFAMVMFESLIYSVIAVPTGSVLAFISGSAVVNRIAGYKIFDAFYGEGVSEQFFSYDINPYIMAAVIFIALFSIFFSSYADALRVMRMPPIKSAVYGSGKSGKKKRKLWISRKIFGYEFGFAVKTIARNKIRFAITVLAAVMSGVLFISIATVSELSGKISFAYRGDDEYDMGIYLRTEPDKKRDVVKDYNTLKNSGYFSKVSFFNSTSYVLDRSSIDDEFRSNFNFDAEFEIIDVSAVTPDTFQALDTDISYEELRESGKILLCDTYTDMNSNEITGLINGDGRTELHFKTDGGDAVTLQSIGKYSETNSTHSIMGAILKAVIPYENFDELNAANPASKQLDILNYYSFDMDLTDGTVDMDEVTDFLYENFAGEKYFGFYDNTYETRVMENVMKALRAAGYALAAVLFAVAALNIISTMSSGMINRRKELSVMRSCGMSMKQIFASVTIEGFFYSVISAVVSGFAGYAIAVTVDSMYNYSEASAAKFPFGLTFAVFAAVELLMLISVTVPLIVMSSASIADDIRNE